jgi:hypothetical protein
VKSDKADALPEMLRTGWYRAVYVKSQPAEDHAGRAISWCEPNVRLAIRCADYCGIRTWQGTKKFAERAHQAVRRDNMLHASVTALLETLAAIEGQIARLEEQLKELARRSPVCWS